MKYADLFRLDGKTALITGSTKGIGRAIAEAMAAQGAQVVISSRKADACDEVADEINAAGGRAAAIPCNISYKDQIEELVSGARQAFGAIDILVCNAAVNPYYGPMAKVSDEAYEKTMGANVRSNLWLCNLVIPEMAAREDGAVIIVSSVAGLKGTSNIGIYALSKAADMQLARNLAVEWGRSNVRANCLAPSIIKTDMAKALWDDPDTYRHAVSTYALGRIGEVEEVAGAAVFLASPAGRFVTGQTLVIDGGATIFGGM
ncbi:MAG: SDR family oxidoreductase [Rhodospirillaceae bacterium]|nr:SDR family oxidoreductase [Rhodospirillaceae bacterium]